MKSSTMLKSVVAAAVIFSSTALLAGEELIQNGSFENFSVEKDNGKWKIVQFENWNGRGEVWNHQLGRIATDGTYKAELDVGRRSVDELSQAVVTKEGVKYLLSLDAYARRANTSDFELLVDGVALASISPTSVWGKFGVEFIGNGSVQTVSIRETSAQDNGLGAVIDNISVASDASLEEFIGAERSKFEIIEPTGIDQIQQIMDADQVVKNFIPVEDVQKAREAAQRMNELIKEAVINNGLANDGAVTRADVREINIYLMQRHSGEWSSLLEDFKKASRKPQRNERGAKRVISMQQVAMTQWEEVYKVGLQYGGGNQNKSRNYFNKVGYTLGAIFRGDVTNGSLKNPDFKEVAGTTGTGMDKGVDLIMTEMGLQRRIPTSDLREGATSANEMNKLILEAITNEGLANDGKISTADVRTINEYLVVNHKEKWKELHGDDENNEETGFHKVQNDGATGRMFGNNFVNTVADGVYHLGFPTKHANNLENEDGNKNQTFEKVAWWLNSCLREDLELKTLANYDYKEIEGTTGTIFDRVIPVIYNDKGLEYRVSMNDIREGASSANGMNELIVEAIRATDAAADKYISAEEVKEINKYLVQNYASQWAELHGDDENNEETGYHKVQNDGASSRAYGQNILNQMVDSVYHLGFPTRYENNLENEDGNKNASFSTVAYWFNKALKGDCAKDLF